MAVDTDELIYNGPLSAMGSNHLRTILRKIWETQSRTDAHKLDHGRTRYFQTWIYHFIALTNVKPWHAQNLQQRCN